MSLIYFKLDKACLPAEIQVDECYQLRVCRPKMNNFHNILWRFLSALSFRSPKFMEYQYLYEGEVVAYLQVIHRLPFFRYIPIGGVHTGPAFTLPVHRGRGLHPALLWHIINDNRDKDFYNCVDETNIASIKGIERIGYKPFAVGHKRFKFYVVEKYL